MSEISWKKFTWDGRATWEGYWCGERVALIARSYSTAGRTPRAIYTAGVAGRAAEPEFDTLKAAKAHVDRWLA